MQEGPEIFPIRIPVHSCALGSGAAAVESAAVSVVALSCGMCVGGFGWMVVRFVCVIRVCACVSRLYVNTTDATQNTRGGSRDTQRTRRSTHCGTPRGICVDSVSTGICFTQVSTYRYLSALYVLVCCERMLLVLFPPV